MKGTRAIIISIFIHGLFISLLAGLAYMQIVRAKYYGDLSRNNYIRVLPLEAPRGVIYDRNGVKIADNILSFDLVLLPREIKALPADIERLADALSLNRVELAGRIAAAKNVFEPLVIKSNIGKSEAIAIEEKTAGLAGITVNTRPLRSYPYPSASSALGYLGRLAEDELPRLKRYGYTARDLVGRSGLEEYYDSYLKGTSGGIQTEVDSRGRLRRVLGYKDPVKGKDIYTTIDARLQKAAAEALEGNNGAVIIMNPGSGEILAIMSSPAYDSNAFVRSNKATVKHYIDSKDRPLFNRAISGEYPPGSTFKAVVAQAALENKKMSADESLECTGAYNFSGQNFKCWKEGGHGYQNVKQAITHSCNVYFYKVGRMLGAEAIYKEADAFGFGRKSDIDLPYERPGLLPSPTWKAKNKKARWYDGDTVNFSVGQGFLLATPLQVLRMMSASAAGGRLARPYLVYKIEDFDVSSRYAETVDISSGVTKTIKDALRNVVADESGTGRKAAVTGVDIAGKTGTAQASKGRPHAWFTGFAPVKEPKVALVVLLEHGGKGGSNASMIAGKLFSVARDLGYL